MLKKILLFVFFTFLLLSLVLSSVYFYHHYTQKQQQRYYDGIYQQASAWVESELASDALDLLNQHFKESEADGLQVAWPAMMVKASLRSNNYSQLEHLLARHPHILLVNESAALWWSRIQMHRRMWSAVAPLWAIWEPQTKLRNRWHLLEADHFMLLGQDEQAREVLESWSASGVDEMNRQLRLALLANQNDRAFEALELAYQAMPSAAEVRATSAQFFERSGAIPLARREYIAAYLLAPENPFHAHQLADFYVRLKALPQAVQTWRESYLRTGNIRSWWNIWFWERVTRTRGAPLSVENGEWWGSLPTTFMGTNSLFFLPKGFLVQHLKAPAILSGDEGYNWLVVLEHLRLVDERVALDALGDMPSGSPEIASNQRILLDALLNWRVHGRWPRLVTLNPEARLHRFYRELEHLRMNRQLSENEPMPPMERFMASDWAVSSLFLANGWLAAAQRLQPEPVPSTLIEGIPELNWLPFAQIKQRAMLDGPAAALELERLYPGDDAVAGFAAECRLMTGDVKAALSGLERVMQSSSPAGYRAAYLRAMAALEQQDYELLEAILKQRSDLGDSISGRELTAKAALQQEQPEAAKQIYDSLGDASVEGSIYRYHSALALGSREEAKQILNGLIERVPNDLRFHRWMRELNMSND
jgi:tetratricopeptide (TPR) repeat protein